MKKLLLVLICVLLLASCTQGQIVNKNTSAPSDTTTAEAAKTPAPSPSAITIPTSTPDGFISCKQGDKVSENFYSGDLERFFMLSYNELCELLGPDYEASDEWVYTIRYSRLGASFEYSIKTDDKNIIYDFDPDAEEPALSLLRANLSAFDFRGLNESSTFENIISKLGNTDLLVLHKEECGYYYALCYIFSGQRYEFSCPDETGAGGLTLTVTPSSDSQVFYKSCGEGDSVSPALTTGDIKFFLELTPEDLDGIIGNGSSGADEDTGGYYINFEYLGVNFAYTLEEAEQGDDIIAFPVKPLEYVWIDDFEFRGLNKHSSFKDVMQVLGEQQVLEVPIVDASYFAIYYTIDGMKFEFSGYDDQASKGVSLCIMPK